MTLKSGELMDNAVAALLQWVAPADIYTETPLCVLKEVFKKDKFRSKQKEIIEAVIEKKDVIVMLPTGV